MSRHVTVPRARRSRGGRSFREMFADRMAKEGLYDSPAYWDMKADAYEGLARSIWPSNVYNRHWDRRQMELIDRALPDVHGLRVVDVACGTGRAARHLARRGAQVTGLDFAPKTLDVARAETENAGLAIDYRLQDALVPPAQGLRERFDIALTISCLAMACADEPSFEKGLAHVASLVRPGGALLFLEPIHSFWLVRRILRMDVGRWVDRCERAGLTLTSRGGMGFLPARMALAFRDLPEGIVGPVFRFGESLLDRFPRLPLGDYTWLLFQKAA